MIESLPWREGLLATAYVLAVLLPAGAFFWLGLAIGYRTKLREATHLEWPTRPWWAPRRWIAWATGPLEHQTIRLEIDGKPVGYQGIDPDPAPSDRIRRTRRANISA